MMIARGDDLTDYYARKKERCELEEESKAYYGLEPEKWPPLVFNWDLSYDSQRFGFDSMSQDVFEKDYPDGFIAVWCVLSEFDGNLCHYSRRDGNIELWELGYDHALAYLIAYLRRGKPITPPIITLKEDNEFLILGGNHRYAAAKASGVNSIPIYIDRLNYNKVNSLIRLL